MPESSGLDQEAKVKYCCDTLRETNAKEGHMICPDPGGDGVLWTFVHHFEKSENKIGIGLRWYFCPFCGEKFGGNNE